MERTNARWERIIEGTLVPKAHLVYHNLDDALDRAIYKSMLPKNQGMTVVVVSYPDEFDIGREFYVFRYENYLANEMDDDLGYIEAFICDGAVEVDL